MAEVITKTYIEKTGIIQQSDIFKDVEYIEYAIEGNDGIEVSKIHFPYVVVLTQACDLEQDFNAKKRIEVDGKGDQDKFLISVIVAPMYNFNDFLSGEHLAQLGMKMQLFSANRKKSDTKNIISNENKRYHYLKFESHVPLVESVVDFKHYFTVSINYLNSIYKTNYVCSIDSLYRELLVQRYASFLSRIGLPDPMNSNEDTEI